jgi:transcriptional regulator with XRE-family HTH domain
MPARLQIKHSDCSPLGKFILQYMEENQVSMNELARQADVSQPLLRGACFKQTCPRPETLKKLSRVLGKHHHELYAMAYESRMADFRDGACDMPKDSSRYEDFEQATQSHSDIAYTYLGISLKECSPLGLYILHHLKKHNMTIAELAEKAGLPQLKGICRSINNPRTSTIHKLAKAMETSLGLIEALVRQNRTELMQQTNLFDLAIVAFVDLIKITFDYLEKVPVERRLMTVEEAEKALTNFEMVFTDLKATPEKT